MGSLINSQILDEVKNGKKIILIAGASSSGKNFVSSQIKKSLVSNGYNCVEVSTDAFYKSNPRIILENYLINN